MQYKNVLIYICIYVEYTYLYTDTFQTATHFLTCRQFLCHPQKALHVAEREESTDRGGMQLVQHLKRTRTLTSGTRNVQKPTDKEPTFLQNWPCPEPPIDRWSEAVTQANQTLYGLRTKALIITLQTDDWWTRPWPQIYRNYNARGKENQTSGFCDRLSFAVCSTVCMWRSESLSASSKAELCRSINEEMYLKHKAMHFSQQDLTIYCSLISKHSPYKTREPNALQSNSVNKRFLYRSK